MLEHSSQQAPQHPDVRYEKTDAQVSGIIAFGAGLLMLGLITHLAVGSLFVAFGDRARRDDPQLPVLAAKRPRFPDDLTKIPPPVLQKNEITDFQRLREAEDRRLSGYGWVDAKAGVVHIPIAEAMRLAADPKIAAMHGIRSEAVKKKGGR
jgi:hypothetical protein